MELNVIPQPRRRAMPRALFVWGLMVAVWASGATAWGQRGGRKKPGLSSAELRQLPEVADGLLAWMTDTKPQRPSPNLVAAYWATSRIKLEREAPEDDDRPRPTREQLRMELGLYALAIFAPPQQKRLVQLLHDQAAARKEYLVARHQLSQKLQSVKAGEPPKPRVLERELKELGRDAGTKEAALAQLQFAAFSEIAEALNDDQRELLHLVATSPTALAKNSAAVARVEAAIARFSDVDRWELKALALKALAVVALPAAAPREPWESASLFGSRGDAVKERVDELLKSLNPAQQLGLAQLAQGRHQALAGWNATRSQIALLLRGSLSGNKPLNERKLSQLGAAAGEQEALLALALALGYQQLQGTFSKAQLAFVSGAVLND